MRSEQDLRRLADRAFCPVYLRAATAYGASPLLRFDLAVNNLVAWAAITGRVFLKSLGTSWRPFVHIEDIAAAYLVALQAPPELVHNQAFNVGRTGENYVIRQVAEFVRATLPETRIEFADDAAPDRRNYRVNCDRIARTLPSYRPRFNRIAYLRKLLEDERVGPDLRWMHPLDSAAE